MKKFVFGLFIFFLGVIAGASCNQYLNDFKDEQIHREKVLFDSLEAMKEHINYYPKHR